MNPKIEVVRLNIAKKGHQTGTFSVKVGFDGGCEVTLPGMRIVEGPKGTFVDLPSQKFKEEGFIPFFYLNKALRDLIAAKGLEAYAKAVVEKPASPAPVVPGAVPGAVVAAKPQTWPKKEWKQSYVKK